MRCNREPRQHNSKRGGYIHGSPDMLLHSLGEEKRCTSKFSPARASVRMDNVATIPILSLQNASPLRNQTALWWPTHTHSHREIAGRTRIRPKHKDCSSNASIFYFPFKPLACNNATISLPRVRSGKRRAGWDGAGAPFPFSRLLAASKEGYTEGSWTLRFQCLSLLDDLTAFGFR